MILPPAVPAILKPIPVPMVQLVAQSAFARVLARHPRIYDRLGQYADRTYCFAPTDLPFEFAVCPRSGKVRTGRPGRLWRTDVRIAGPLVLLLALAEGRVDGDAEFFGRQLSIDGDMEAVLALRNALENDAVDFARDLAPTGGPLRSPVETMLGRVRSVLLAGKDHQWS